MLRGGGWKIGGRRFRRSRRLLVQLRSRLQVAVPKLAPPQELHLGGHPRQAEFA
jgi:hypothetical protein